MSIIPLFKSHYSVGKSILTLEKATEITDSSPISIFSIAKKHGLKEITLVEDSISGFIQAYSYAKDMGIKLIFGLQILRQRHLDHAAAGHLHRLPQNQHLAQLTPACKAILPACGS